MNKIILEMESKEEIKFQCSDDQSSSVIPQSNSFNRVWKEEVVFHDNNSRKMKF